MHDNWLIAIAMSIAGIGITMLLLALLFIEPEQTTIDTASVLQDNTPTHIIGTTQSIKIIGNKTIITITQPSKIDVIIESSTINQTEIKKDIIKDPCIDIVGKKSSYNNKAQIIASKVQHC